ncbi:DUF835 domain-containing protein [Thermococcus peptonophilus]|uniref:DUF835 domain-containing protein n=1 Tax=Thermococcus peptonophilus TaxID=53952 RepID=UPI00346574B5
MEPSGSSMRRGFHSLSIGGKYVSITPFVITLYMLVAERSSEPNWLATVGIAYAVSGLFMVLSGLMLVGLKDLYENYSKYLGITLIINGTHEMDYPPLLRPVEWFAPIGFSLSAALTILIAYFFVKFVGHEEFLRPHLETAKPLKEIEPGLILLSPKEYRNLLSELQELPLIAFTRSLNKVPEKWMVYTISQIEHKRTIQPTNLSKITEIVNRYLKTVGKGGVVLIDGIEYISMYNGFEAVAKWLSTLRDIAYVNDGNYTRGD